MTSSPIEGAWLGALVEVQEAVHLTIEDDPVIERRGDTLDAQLMRAHLAAWGEGAAHAVSHVRDGVLL